MLDISNGKVVRVIFLAREYGPESPHLHDYISGLNEDEQVSLVAIMWIGRDSFDADEVAEAIATARTERTAPTEDYLSARDRRDRGGRPHVTPCPRHALGQVIHDLKVLGLMAHRLHPARDQPRIGRGGVHAGRDLA